MNETHSQQTVSHKICDWISEQGIRHVFLVPGSQIDHLSATMVKESEIEMIVTCIELGAGFMADGYSRVSGTPGVCMGTGGPGSAYMMPSAMISRVDESSVLYVTGDVPSWLKKQLCFQDTGHRGSRDREAFRTLMDFSTIISHPGQADDILQTIKSRLSSHLPAHLVIPCDVQCKLAPVDSATMDFPHTEVIGETGMDAQEAAGLIADAIIDARNPVILVGHSLLWGQGPEVLKQFAEYSGIHVATTYRAKGVLGEDHPLSAGIFGFAGSRTAFDRLTDPANDFLLLLGAPVNQRNSFYWNERFVHADRRVIAVNTDGAEVFGVNPNHQSLTVPDIAQLMLNVLERLKKRGYNSPHHSVESTRSQVFSAPLSDDFEGHPRLDWALDYLRNEFPPETLMFVDSGAHRVVAGSVWSVTQPGTFFTSDVEAPMGWAICAAIGGKIAKPHVPVIALTGDGCMRMLGNEIATAARYRLPVIFLVSNNRTYCSIRKRAGSENVASKLGDIPAINWADYARSLGAEGYTVNHGSELTIAVSLAKKSEIPFVIDLRTHPGEPFPAGSTLPPGLWPDPGIVSHPSS
jgi:acetolactate synthase I/II/III large subunit